uniref:Uncharacterized protein n=1 Tax=Anguilla anguilla TaxID=7936 RepID=A0A0E9SSF2_ANGAN
MERSLQVTSEQHFPSVLPDYI